MQSNGSSRRSMSTALSDPVACTTRRRGRHGRDSAVAVIGVEYRALQSMRTQHNLVLQVHLQACQGLRFTLAAQDSVTEKASVSFARIGTHYKTRRLFCRLQYRRDQEEGKRSLRRLSKYALGETEAVSSSI
ncbi:hypothetical protein PR002_g23152 [Phytophthora rubi]|uniref:Uncharacterized protein n=3 Tax=Phytophthora rubi TaxID=129364 RepID=A0A6A3IP57_9STRA|nr:hypothetical protein PR002_g23152 [Phytophthora rubi]